MISQGVNKGKVILILAGVLFCAFMYAATNKDFTDAVGIWINENLGSKKLEVTEGTLEEKAKPPVIIKIERPEPKPSAKFTFHYKLYGRGDLVTNAETVNWKIAAIDETQVTWESDSHTFEAFSRNPFLPPLSAPESLFNKTPRLDYLSPTEIFPLTSSEPKVVRIQDRTVTDSKPYEWSCLITGSEKLNTMAGEFPVEVVTCVASGFKTGTETFKYSKAHGHWIVRERRGFDQPMLSVELVSYSAD